MSKITELKISKSQIEQLAKNLRMLLDERHLSESNVAQSLDIPVMTVRRIVSGETTDPRIYTLKLLADYFNITIDSLIDDNSKTSLSLMNKNMPKFIPIIDWKTIASIKSIGDIDLKTWKAWQPIALGSQYSLSDQAFALESTPSMQPRFPVGTLFVIDPTEAPVDGDMVLIQIKAGGDLSLRGLVIDPPKWQLLPVILGSEIIFYEKKHHDIIGVVILTMLNSRNRKIAN